MMWWWLLFNVEEKFNLESKIQILAKWISNAINLAGVRLNSNCSRLRLWIKSVNYLLFVFFSINYCIVRHSIRSDIVWMWCNIFCMTQNALLFKMRMALFEIKLITLQFCTNSSSVLDNLIKSLKWRQLAYWALHRFAYRYVYLLF